MCQLPGMTFRALLLIVCAALILGSAVLVLETSDLTGAVDAAFRGVPLVLPEPLLVGTAAFFAVLAVVAGGLLWPVAARTDRRDKAAAERIGAELARFQREVRTRDKARRAEVMRARSLWEKERQQGAAPPPGGWARWAGPLLAGVVAAGFAAAWAPGVFPDWLRTRGYEPCGTLDESRWVRTRHGLREIRELGWALPQDCPAARD